MLKLQRELRTIANVILGKLIFESEVKLNFPGSLSAKLIIKLKEYDKEKQISLAYSSMARYHVFSFTKEQTKQFILSLREAIEMCEN